MSSGYHNRVTTIKAFNKSESMMNNSMSQYDIIIVGGGMVGSALACRLAQTSLKIAMIERQAPTPFDVEQAMDLRVSAISASSQQLLRDMNVWDEIEAMRSCPYRYLETWENEGSHLLFDSHDMHRDCLGHIVENRIIQLALWERIKDFDNITVLSGQTINHINAQTSGYDIQLGEQQLHCKLLIGADGANSMVRTAANIGVTAWDYQQHAMLISTTTAAPQQDITWQKFFPSGPRAFLPLANNNASLVWYDSPARIKALSSMPLSQLTQEVIEHFPNRLGEFNINSAGSFPLTRRHAQQYVKPHVCLVGDAAHTINPLAGQGVNLGFKDVDCLSQVITDAVNHGDAWWQESVLKKYEKTRRKDNLLMQSAMDAFYLTFSNHSSPLQFIRNVALKTAQQFTWGKKQVMKYAMGL